MNSADDKGGSAQQPQRIASCLPITSIVIGKRHRRDLGDIAGLARAIEQNGLFHPVVITPNRDLIAGERRIAAYKHLGRTDIPVTVIDLDDIVRGELSENADRKDFLPSEIEAIRRALAPVEKAAAVQRMTQGGKVGKLSTPSESGKTRDKIAAFAGVSGRTVEKIAAVVAAAEREPERFGKLVEHMDRTRRVDGAYNKLRQAQDEDRVKALVPLPGKYRTLVIDSPWESDWLSPTGQAALRYATMSHDELLALPVPDWAEDNCHLYIWTLNNFITRAVELMAHWGFQHKSLLTWVKPRWGRGHYFRNTTEHVLFGIRGELPTRSDSIATHFEAPLGEPSEKPERFYEIVRAASYPPFGEAFQRKARADFINLYGEATEDDFPDLPPSLRRTV